MTKGEELAQYVERRPADAFKLMLPPPGADRFDLPLRGEDRLPYWPKVPSGVHMLCGCDPVIVHA